MLSNLADLAVRRGEDERACRLAEEAVASARSLGDRQAAAIALIHFANALRGLGDPTRAAARYDEALALFREVGHRAGAASALRGLGLVALDEDDTGRALPLLSDSLAILRETGEKGMIAVLLAAVARGMAALGRWDRAARLYGAAAALREAIGALGPTYDPAANSRAIAAARAGLGDAAFATAEATGRALPLERAIAEALALTDGLA
jgi:tetratricopeptide (TPR) repeat protein